MQARRRRDNPLPVAGQVTSLELFFDLVFVFTITQLTATVLPGGWATTGRTALLLLAAVVDVRRLRVADQRRAAGHPSAADPAGAGDDRPLRHRAGDPARVRLGPGRLRLSATCSWSSCTPPCTSPRPPGSPAAWWCSCSAGTWLGALLGLVGALFFEDILAWWWLASFVVAVVLPRLFSITALNQPEDDGGPSFELVPGHFVERHGLMLLIALGESVLAIGVGLGTGVGSIGLDRIVFAVDQPAPGDDAVLGLLRGRRGRSRRGRSRGAAGRPSPGRRPGVVRLCLLGDPLRDRAQRRRPASCPRASGGPSRLGVRRPAVPRGRACSGWDSACSGSPWVFPARCRAWSAGSCWGRSSWSEPRCPDWSRCSACCSGRPRSCCPSSAREHPLHEPPELAPSAGPTRTVSPSGARGC